jgi:hypothetical protein
MCRVVSHQLPHIMEARTLCVGFVVNSVALGQVFVSTVLLPCQYHLTNAPHSIHPSAVKTLYS